MIRSIMIEIFRRFKKKLNMKMTEFHHHHEVSKIHKYKILMNNLNQNVTIEPQKLEMTFSLQRKEIQINPVT